MHLFIYTFNLNGSYINVDVLNHIYEKIESLNYKPDVIVLGFQETRFGFNYYLPKSKLHNRYELIHKVRMNGLGNVGIRGLGLYICKLENYKPNIEFLEENWVRFNYQYFSKGAISISIKIFNSNFLFINTHMPYHPSYYGDGIKERIDSFNVIYNYIISKTNHQYLFIIGDFNFRLHFKINTDFSIINVNNKYELIDLYIKNKVWKVLHFNDELYILSSFYNNLLDNLNNNLYGEEYGYVLNEPLLPFYKYIFDTPEFNLTYKLNNDQSQNNQEIPCWCDRILTIEYPGFKRINYILDSNTPITLSDHNPIYSLFHIDDKLICQY